MSEGMVDVFDAEIVSATAAENEVPVSALEEDLDTVQRVVAGFGDLSVDDIVYEWRTRHHRDPLVARTETAYYLDVREHVWDDVLARADVASHTAARVRAVHEAQFASDRDEDAPEGAMVLARP